MINLGDAVMGGLVVVVFGMGLWWQGRLHH